MYNLIDAGVNDLEMLYNGSAFTFEGLDTSRESMKSLMTALKDYVNPEMDELTIYVVKGSLMNDRYGLWKDPYPDRLSIVAIPTNQFKDIGKLAMFKLQVGARWFDDIVDNNVLFNNKAEEEF